MISGRANERRRRGEAAVRYDSVLSEMANILENVRSNGELNDHEIMKFSQCSCAYMLMKCGGLRMKCEK